MALDAALGRLGIKAGVCTSSTRPANPFEGQVIYETDTDTLLTWNGSSWLNLDQSTKGSDYTIIASGTTAERPVSPTAGMIRFNETTGEPEWYSSVASKWVNFRQSPDLSVSYVVAAGGGGGGNFGGGGGAGGFTSGSISLLYGTSYTVTVGAGGGGSTSENARGSNGFDSVFGSFTVTGGGGGGSNGSVPTKEYVHTGSDGGSGGGESQQNTTAGAPGSGISGQGNDGGNAYGTTSGHYGGGGGGAGSVGGDAASGVAGLGGTGITTNILTSAVASTSSVGEVSGSLVYFCGGGGGQRYPSSGTIGSGGLGGGGDGGSYLGSTAATSGATNTGGGGGAGQSNVNGSGGSGVVILRFSNSMPLIDPGLSYSTATIGADTLLLFTAGTGTVTW